MEEYTNEYKGIKGWFPKSIIKLLEELEKEHEKIIFKRLWGCTLEEFNEQNKYILNKQNIGRD